jgi:hypothetical protein
MIVKLLNLIIKVAKKIMIAQVLEYAQAKDFARDKLEMYVNQ